MTLLTAKKQGYSSNLGNQTGWVIAAVVILLLIGVLGFMALPQLKKLAIGLPGLGAPAGKTSGYQAVFLANDQVYFGKLSGLYSDDPVLHDVYYLKVDTVTENPSALKNTPVEVKKTGSKETTPSATPKPTAAPTQRTITNLIKMGEELHGPVDELRLTWDQILYVEDLRDNSPLVESIKRYQTSLPKK